MADTGLQLIPLTIKRSNEFVAELHRHHKPVVGAKFCLGAIKDGKLVGCIVVGRPVSRMLDDGQSAEVTRCCTDGTKNACSFLYGAARRTANEMGFRRLFTYTLPEEGGASLRAAGWMCDGNAGGGSWGRDSRPREDKHPTTVKLRWQAWPERASVAVVEESNVTNQ